MWWAKARASAESPARVANPLVTAACWSTFSPAIRTLRATEPPSSSTARLIVQRSSAKPWFTAGTHALAPGPMTRRSQDSTNWQPAPTAGPWTSAMTGKGTEEMAAIIFSTVAKNPAA